MIEAPWTRVSLDNLLEGAVSLDWSHEPSPEKIAPFFPRHIIHEQLSPNFLRQHRRLNVGFYRLFYA
jgi:hypothetical protein